MISRLHRQRQGGFTLIELLVVMAIIGILAMILVPAFGKAKRNALRMKCASNLRQIGMSVKMYLMDHDKLFPPMDSENFGTLATYYLPYLNGETDVFRCPAQRNYLPSIYTDQHLEIPGQSISNAWVSYGFNSFFIYITNGPVQWTRTLTSHDVQDASICAYMYDYPFDPSDADNIPYLAHPDGINILYCDWHVSWLPQKEFITDGKGFWEKGHLWP
jgi:prepilin-type N-terminal cleavage/methylation domain-containing protein/prepilin-type processing-associated H-X9-DG protein